MRPFTKSRRTLAVLLASTVAAFLPYAGAAENPPSASAVAAGPLANTRALSTQPPGGSFTGVTPARLLDTRIGIGAPMHTVPAGGQVELLIAGRGGVPLTGVASVALNVTVTRPASAGYLTVFPAGAPRPTTSNVNFKAGQTVALRRPAIS